MELEARTNEDNPDPRVACALLLDTSSSMLEAGRIDLLNDGFELFCKEIREDPLAQKRTEACVISFGGSARVEIPFTEGRDLQARRLAASGATPMGAALNIALDEIEAQKAAYKQAGLEYYRPWLFIFTDGAPTDGPVFEQAAARIRAAEAAKGITVFAVYVDGGSAIELEKLSARRKPLKMRNDPGTYKELFSWLSASMSQVANSSEFGTSDTAIEDGQTALPSPAGWATW